MTDDARLQSDGYVLAREDEEYQRLNAQAKAWEEATERTLRKAGVSAGQRCLDVGCGTGTAMRILGGLVGPSGAVVGIDLDERIGRLAVGALNDEQPGRHRFEPLDIVAADTAPGAPFDVVFTRLVIFHMKEQAKTLKKLWSWVAPGGVLVVMDYDLAPVKSYPTNETAERGILLMNTVFTRAGRDPSIGVRLPLHFIDAGIGAPDGTDIAGALTPSSRATAMLRALLHSLRPAGIALGVLDAAGFDAMDRDLAAEAETPGFARGPDMVSVWKRKPR